MSFEWGIEPERLFGRVRARTCGWLAVGFNDRAGLQGARLVMCRLIGDKIEIEEHEVDPPRHRARRDSRSVVSALGARRVGADTEIEFALALERLRAGQRVELILAYSTSTDFDHHSAMRGHQSVEL
jgi:hypothetical protein